MLTGNIFWAGNAAILPH